jgi:hypothetical protein
MLIKLDMVVRLDRRRFKRTVVMGKIKVKQTGGVNHEVGRWW